MINRRHVKFRIYKHVEQLYDVFKCVSKSNVKFLRKFLISYIMLQCYFSKKNKYFYVNFFKFLKFFFLRKYISLRGFIVHKIKLLRFFFCNFISSYSLFFNFKLFKGFRIFFFKFISFMLSFFKQNKNQNFYFSKIICFFARRFFFFFRLYQTIFLLRFVYLRFFNSYYRVVFYYFVLRYKVTKLFKLFRFLSRRLNKSIYNFIYKVVYNLMPDSFLSIQKKKRLYQFLIRNIRNFRYLYKYILFILSSKKQFRMKNSFFLRKLNFRKSLLLNFNIDSSNYFNMFFDKNPKTVGFFFDSLNYKPDVYLVQLGWLSSFHSSLLRSSFFFINGKPLDNLYYILQVGDTLSFHNNLLNYVLFRRRYNVFSLFRFINFFLNNHILKFKKKKRIRYFRYKKYYFHRKKRIFLYRRSRSFFRNYLMQSKPSYLFCNIVSNLKYKFPYSGLIKYKLKKEKQFVLKNRLSSIQSSSFKRFRLFKKRIVRKKKTPFWFKNKNKFNNNRSVIKPMLDIYSRSDFKSNRAYKSYKYKCKLSRNLYRNDKQFNFSKAYQNMKPHSLKNSKTSGTLFQNFRFRNHNVNPYFIPGLRDDLMGKVPFKPFIIYKPFSASKLKAVKIKLKKFRDFNRFRFKLKSLFKPKLRLKRKHRYNSRLFLRNILLSHFGVLSSKKLRFLKIKKKKCQPGWNSLYVRYRFKRTLFKKNPFVRFIRYLKYFLYRRFFYGRTYTARSTFSVISSFFKLIKSQSGTIEKGFFFSRFFYYLFSNSFNMEYLFSNYKFVRKFFFEPYSVSQFPWIRSLHSLFHTKKLILGFLNYNFYNYRYNYMIFLNRSSSLYNVLYYNSFNYLYNQNHVFNVLNHSKYKFNNLRNNLYLNYFFYKKHYKIRF